MKDKIKTNHKYLSSTNIKIYPPVYRTIVPKIKIILCLIDLSSDLNNINNAKKTANIGINNRRSENKIIS